MGNVPTIQAIPTHYGGILFRSRTEARWAVFFDELGIRWVYEPEGYQLPSGERYLPDFWLEDLGEDGIFFEVKPSADHGEDKAAALATLTHKPVAITSGNEIDQGDVSIALPHPGDDPGTWEARWDYYGFIRCPCGRATLSYCDECPRQEGLKCGPRRSREAFSRLVTPQQAIDRAMRYRFWNPGGAS